MRLARLMRKLLQRLATLSAVWLFRQYQRSAVALARIEAARYYLKGVLAGRQVLCVVLLAAMGLLLLLAGFLALNACLFVLLWRSAGPRVAVGVLAILGAVYFLVPLGLLLYFTSERVWMRVSGASEMVEKLVRPRRRPRDA